VSGWIGVAVLVLVLIVAAALRGPVRRWWQAREFEQARREFQRQREFLEAKFFELASHSGKPRDLIWVDCDFDDRVAFARDRETGEISAFVGTTISFEAVAGGLMEDVEAVGNLRAATAVFRRQAGKWMTQGRVMFNLAPAEAIAFYQEKLERVEVAAHGGRA
jgi:hypothetical protein